MQLTQQASPLTFTRLFCTWWHARYGNVWALVDDVSNVLNAIDRGEPQAADRLLPLLYGELRRLAAVSLEDEPAAQTLNATALVHEAYVRLVGDQKFHSRGHFFGAAAQAMRRILVDRARARHSQKRGGNAQKVDIDEIAAPDSDDRVIALDEALKQLAIDDPLAARVVEMHRFVGMSHDQVAAALDLSVYQVRQSWNLARAWLKTTLSEHGLQPAQAFDRSTRHAWRRNLPWKNSEFFHRIFDSSGRRLRTIG